MKLYLLVLLLVMPPWHLSGTIKYSQYVSHRLQPAFVIFNQGNSVPEKHKSSFLFFLIQSFKMVCIKEKKQSPLLASVKRHSEHTIEICKRE